MILVDSSVWIDFFNGRSTPESEALDGHLGREPVLIGDLILIEVLQGFRSDAGYRTARPLLETLELRQLGGRQIALAAADNYRTLRRRLNSRERHGCCNSSCERNFWRPSGKG